MNVTTRGERRIAWDREGEGPPVLLVPGIGAGAALFGTLPRRFARRGFTCLVVNPVGITPSSPHRGDYDLGEAALDLLAVVDASGSAPCALVGVSMGGKVAAMAAARAGASVSALVLLGSSLVRTARGDAVQQFFATAAGHLGARELALVLAPFLFGSTFAARRPELLADIVRAMRPQPAVRELMVAQARAGHGFDASSWAQRVRCPALCVAGAEDTLTASADVRASADLLPRGAFAEIPDAGHSLLLESAEAFEQVVGFLRAHGAPGAPSG